MFDGQVDDENHLVVQQVNGLSVDRGAQQVYTALQVYTTLQVYSGD